MGTCIQPLDVRRRRRLARLAAAVTGFTARSAAAAGTPLDPATVEGGGPRTPPVHSSYQTWIGFSAAGPIRDPVLAFVDLYGGFHADMHPAALGVRPGVGVRLPHGFTAFAGYAYTSFWSDKHVRGEEHTAFEQVGYQAPFTVVALSARLRVEERFRPNSDVGVRARGLVFFAVPLWRGAPVQAELSNELFLGLNRPGDWQPVLVDLDLASAGLGWAVAPHFLVEGGYQAAIAPRPDEISLVHCLSLSTTVSW